MDSIKTLRETSNRLWIRLTLTLTLGVVIGVVVNTLFGLYLGMQEVARIQGDDVWERQATYQMTQENGVLHALHAYYEKNRSWENIDDAFALIQSFTPPNDRLSSTFSFLDADGSVLYDSHPPNLQDWVNVLADESFPIIVEGELTGYVRLVFATQLSDLIMTETRQDYIIKWFEDWAKNRFAPILLISVVVGVAFGTLVSRTMTAPLRHLAETAEAIGSRDLSSRVAIKGSTEIRQLARSFNTMAADLEQAEKLRRNLVADIAHELRTPLTVLQGNLRAILDNVYPLNKGEVASLYDQTRILSRLVNDLHEIAQAEAKKLPMQMEDIDLHIIIQHITATFQPMAETEGVLVKVSIPKTMPVYGDYARISQVLHNLLINALHHTPAGGTISINAYTEYNHVHIEIKDTGKGISAEHLTHIFERFYRVDRSRSRNKGGAGLGLAISKAIIEAHNGTMNAYSEGIAGRGTSFTFRLPLTQHETPKQATRPSLHPMDTQAEPIA